jgi:TonB family protein
MIVLTYVVKTTLGLFLFYLLYKLIFKEEGILKFNRYYLLFSLIASFLLPLITLNFNIAPEVSTRLFTTGYSAPSVQNGDMLPDNAITESNISDQPIIDQPFVSPVPVKAPKTNPKHFFEIVSWAFIRLYVLGILVLLFCFLYQLRQTLHLIRHSKGENFSKAKLIQHSLEIMPFSIFNYIIINKKHYCEKELQYVLLHEMEHINQKHSFDILLIELLKIVFWINPFVWIYEREIKQNHEYLADRGVLEQGIQTYEYQLILLNSSLSVPKYNIVNNFNKSYIKKRITMMTIKNGHKLSMWKLLLIIPVIFVVLIACSKPSRSNPFENTVVAAEEITDYTKYIELNTPYDWVSYTGGNFFCEGTYTINKIDATGYFEGIQENHTFHGTLPITGKLTKDQFEFYVGSPHNEIWSIKKSESGRLVGKVFADYPTATKNRLTFYLAKHIGYEELLPASKGQAGMEISKNLHIKLLEKYFFETFLNNGTRGFTGWFMITTFNKETNDISGHQGNFRGNALGAFSGKLYNDSIIINIGEPWNEIWKATLEGNLLKGPLKMNPKVTGFEYQIGTHSWVMATSSKPLISVEKAAEVNAPYNVARYSEMENSLAIQLKKNMVYPEKAMKDNIEGRVYVSFKVMTDGSIADAKVERSVNPLLDAEAIRLVNLTSKKWVPGVVDNQPIVSEYLLPIVFKLK